MDRISSATLFLGQTTAAQRAQIAQFLEGLVYDPEAAIQELNAGEGIWFEEVLNPQDFPKDQPLFQFLADQGIEFTWTPGEE